MQHYDRHNIIEILLKVALNTIGQPTNQLDTNSRIKLCELKKGRFLIWKRIFKQ
jgi:hypothetical protein